MTSLAPAFNSRRIGLLIVAAVAATLVAPILIGGKVAFAQALTLPAHAYAVLLAVIVVNWFARALKLHLLFRRLGATPKFARTFTASQAIDFAFMTTPAGVGGYAASVYCARRIGMSLSAATTLTAVDQLLDLAFFTLALPIAALTLIWTDLPRLLWAGAFFASAFTITVAICAFLMRRRLGAWIFGDNALVRRWPSLRRKQHHLREFIASVQSDSRLLAGGGIPWLVGIAILTMVQWLTRYGVFWVALTLLGQHVPFALTLLSQSLILHAAMWTGIPSGGGGAELGLSAVLLPLAPSEIIASALLLWRLVTFYLCLISGLTAIAVLALWRKRDRTGEPQAGDPKLAERTAPISR